MSDDVHFTATMPTKRIAADCLFTDRAGRLLVLEPPYKPTWDLPGGIVERDESPRDAARREVREEIGLHVETGELLVVDWIPRTGDFTEIVAFLFDGGVLTDDDIRQIVLQESEVVSFRFVGLDEAEQLLDRGQFTRVKAGFARRRTGALYLENGDYAPPDSSPMQPKVTPT
ncbi:NUDIX hydrolase [Kribbella jejuensis]|uniref:NUDIX domain-containing protein n=1 Tax=Kribbella jejuensis TaxID=236068 RepID=A0A542ET25_9ACTN|nr:NUDIX hydrolase [Kribbella jejuensis]TQJ18455.1 NUDIX domain-containing protein [Kribbella jejuensis]